MNRSEQINELATALAKAQGLIQGAVKDAKNPFFKSSYADLASITEAIKKPFADNGLSYTQQVVTNEKEECGVEMLLMHSSGQWIHYEPFFLPVSKADAQGFGSCATYAARYQLRAVSGVPAVDDDGNLAAQARPDTAARIVAAKVSPMQDHIDAFDALDADTKDYIQRQADSIIHLHSIKGDTAGFIALQDYDTETKLALWSRLPSNVRSYIKQQQQVASLKKGAPHLAEQA